MKIPILYLCFTLLHTHAHVWLIWQSICLSIQAMRLLLTWIYSYVGEIEFIFLYTKQQNPLLCAIVGADKFRKINKIAATYIFITKSVNAFEFNCAAVVAKRKLRL